MPPVLTCFECGRPLPEGSSEALCPVCALRSVANGAGEPVPDAALADLAGASTNANSPPLTFSLSRPASAVPAVSASGSLPRSFGDYELIEEIARGGMGVVYRAQQKRLNRIVALKLIVGGPLASAAAMQRFHAEARTAAALQHPNIVAIHEVGEHEGQPFFSMDYVEGRNLADLLRDGPLPPRRAAGYTKTIAEAVEYAHRQGILHRDLKPSNVLIDQFDQPRIADFGLAKRVEEARLATSNTERSTPNAQLTLSGQVLGSPNFMAPEQAQGRHRDIGPHSDVYSLGALLYHLLTGRPPFQAATLTEVLRQVVATEPVAPRRLNPSLPHDLETICLKCLEKDISRRYATTQVLADDLGRFLEGKPVLARPVGRLGKLWRWGRRNPRLALATGVAVLSLLIGLAGVSWQARRAQAEALLARRHAYAADMNLAQQALEDHDLARARELLARHRPQGSDDWRVKRDEQQTRGARSAHAAGGSLITHHSSLSTDLRSWEWRYLWGRSRSEERFTLCQYSNAVSALAFSPDAKWLAVRWENDVLALWDAVAKCPMVELPARAVVQPRRHRAVAFSPQGDLLAWGTANSNGAPAASLRDLRTGRELQRFTSSEEFVSLSFSPDGKLLAALVRDGAVLIEDVASGQVVTNFSTTRLKGPLEASSEIEAENSLAEEADRRTAPDLPPAQPPIFQPASFTQHQGCILFSPDGRWLAVGERGQPRVRVWDWSSRQQVKTNALPKEAGGITALAFSPDSARLAFSGGAGDNDIHVWDLAAGTERRFVGHRGWVTDLAFSPDGRRLASASVDQTVRLWDALGDGEPRCLQGNTAEVWAVAWSPEGKNLVTGARDGTVRYWDPASEAKAPYEVLPASVWPSGLAFAPDSKTFLAVSGSGGVVERWDAATLRRIETLPFLGTNHLCLDLSHNGRWLALGDIDGHVRVWEAWDSPDRRLAADLLAPEGRIIAVFFSPRDLYLNAGVLSPVDFCVTKFWERSTWRERPLPLLSGTNLTGIDYAPNGRTVAIGSDGGPATWWDLETGTREAVLSCPDRGAWCVRFSPDGRRFATTGFQGLATLWDVATRRPTPIGPDQPLHPHHPVFSLDGRRLITSGRTSEDLFWIWDVATGRSVATLPGVAGRLYAWLDFSPDGNTLCAGSVQGTVLFWRAPSWAEIEAEERH